MTRHLLDFQFLEGLVKQLMGTVLIYSKKFVSPGCSTTGIDLRSSKRHPKHPSTPKCVTLRSFFQSMLRSSHLRSAAAAPELVCRPLKAGHPGRMEKRVRDGESRKEQELD